MVEVDVLLLLLELFVLLVLLLVLSALILPFRIAERSILALANEFLELFTLIYSPPYHYCVYRHIAAIS